jgi:hypothetical protein
MVSVRRAPGICPLPVRREVANLHVSDHALATPSHWQLLYRMHPEGGDQAYDAADQEKPANQDRDGDGRNHWHHDGQHAKHDQNDALYEEQHPVVANRSRNRLPEPINATGVHRHVRSPERRSAYAGTPTCTFQYTRPEVPAPLRRTQSRASCDYAKGRCLGVPSGGLPGLAWRAAQGVPATLLPGPRTGPSESEESSMGHVAR